MQDWILSNESIIRVSVFLGIFGFMAIWEVFGARRELSESRNRRWLGNLSLVVFDVLALRLVFPAAAVGMAVTAERYQWGLFNNFSVPGWVAVLLSIAALDLVIYLQHVMFHAVPALWKLHRVHHADVDIDITTGARFHPVEILISMGIKLGAVSVLGAPFIAVLVFEVILNALTMFNHSNVHIPPVVENVLRWFIVTPDMHRVHHSVEVREHNTNFGFNLSCWDRALGTYLAQPAKGHLNMIIGLSDFRETVWRTLPRLLIMPFVRPARKGDGEEARRDVE